MSFIKLFETLDIVFKGEEASFILEIRSSLKHLFRSEITEEVDLFL